MRRKRVKVTHLTSSAVELGNLRELYGGLYNRNFAAHWCSWLTRCPLKAEITGSSPVCAAKSAHGFYCCFVIADLPLLLAAVVENVPAS